MQFCKGISLHNFAFPSLSPVEWLVCLNTSVRLGLAGLPYTDSTCLVPHCHLHHLWSWPWKLEFFVSPSAFISSWALPTPLFQVKRQSNRFSLKAPPTGPFSTLDTWTFNYSLWPRSRCVCPKYYTLWNKICWMHIHFCIYMFSITSWSVGKGKAKT